MEEATEWRSLSNRIDSIGNGSGRKRGRKKRRMRRMRRKRSSSSRTNRAETEIAAAVEWRLKATTY